MALPSLKVKLRVKENVNNIHRKVFILICLIITVFDSFKGMQPFSNTSKEVLQDQYISLVQYTTSYFDVPVIQPVDLLPRLHKLKQEDAPELWALIELCLCCPYGNAVCESHPELFLTLTNMETNFSKFFCNRIRQDGTTLPRNSKIQIILLFLVL